MNELQVFTSPAFGEIRTLEIGGEPWFVGKDVAQALGYGKGSALSNAVANHVDAEDKGVTELMTPGGKQKTIIINESGLYSLVLSSKLPTAKEFKRWVTSEILPAIRKHGVYMTASAAQQAIENPETIYDLAKALLEERERADRLRPKAEYAERCLMATDGVSITSIAKEYGMSGLRLNQILHGLGIQYRSGNQWVLYAKYQDRGYTVTRTTPIKHSDGRPDIVVQTMWTQTGKQFIDQNLRKMGIAK